VRGASWGILALGAVAALAAGCKSESAAPGAGVVRIEWPDGAPATPAMLEEQRTELASDAVLADALARLAKEGGAAEPYGGPDAVARLRADLRVERVPGADCLGVRLEGGPENRRASVVRAVLEAFVASKSDRGRDERRKKIETERDSLRRRAADAERNLGELRTRLGLVTTDPAADERRVRLDALGALADRRRPAFDRAKAEWNEFQALQAQAADAKNAAVFLKAYPRIAEAIESDPGVAGARAEVERLEKNLESLRAKYGNDAEPVRRMLDKLEEARAELRICRAPLAQALLEEKAAILRRDRDRAVRDEGELARETGEARAAAERIAPDVETFRRHEKASADLRARLGEVEEELTRLRVEASVGQPAATVVQWP
jgi:hypothetical protein